MENNGKVRELPKLIWEEGIKTRLEGLGCTYLAFDRTA
jgi:hypothetical protein